MKAVFPSVYSYYKEKTVVITYYSNTGKYRDFHKDNTVMRPSYFKIKNRKTSTTGSLHYNGP